MKEVFDTLMKKQLKKMAGSEVDCPPLELENIPLNDCPPLELRKFPIIDGDSTNFESATFEQLKALGKPIKLQKLVWRHSYMKALELHFTDGLESATYTSSSFSSSNNSHEITWDTSKQIKKVSIYLRNNGSVGGIQLLDEKNNELVIHSGAANNGAWQPAKEIPDGFEIIGVYGDTTKDYCKVQFGFLIWNGNQSNLNW